jgi:hypothetical protein
LINAFEGCDTDDNNYISVNEFVTLNRFLESERFDLKTCVEQFFKKADQMVEDEPHMSFDKFSAVCTDNDLFSNESQMHFLGVYSQETLVILYEYVKENWSKLKDELILLRAALGSLTDRENKKFDDIIRATQGMLKDPQNEKRIATLLAYRLTLSEFQRIKEEDEILGWVGPSGETECATVGGSQAQESPTEGGNS